VTRTRSVSEPRIAKSDYVVHLASRYPHKGTDWLLRRWECLQDRSKDTPELRLVGEISTAGTEIVGRLRRVSRQPHLGRTELDVLIAGARALLLPSEVEGFGLPALEAYYLGTAVAYVLGTAVEEILGPGTAGGFSFEDGSFDAALDAVLQLSPDAIRQKADELDTRFHWERCVELTSAAYRRLLRS
jgi:glycosyltransferase involved in cell wall biosynthesis